MKQKSLNETVEAFVFADGLFASLCSEANEEQVLHRDFFFNFLAKHQAMTMPLPYCVYILFSEKDHLLYIGFTSNIQKKIENHNAGLVGGHINNHL